MDVYKVIAVCIREAFDALGITFTCSKYIWSFHFEEGLRLFNKAPQLWAFGVYWEKHLSVVILSLFNYVRIDLEIMFLIFLRGSYMEVLEAFAD